MGYTPTDGHYEHCGTCSGPVFVRHPIGHIDYMVYCQKCAALPKIGEDDVVDAHETLSAVTLLSTFFRMLRIKEVYYRDP